MFKRFNNKKSLLVNIKRGIKRRENFLIKIETKGTKSFVKN